VKVHAVLIAGVIALGSSSALADPLRPIFGGVLPPTEINGIVRSMGLTPTSQPIREGLAYAVLATYLGGKSVRVIVDARSGNVLSVRRVISAGPPGNYSAPPRHRGPIGRARPPALPLGKPAQKPAVLPASPNWAVTIDPSATNSAANPKPTGSTPSFPPVQSLE